MSRRGSGPNLAIVSLALLAVLIGMLVWLSGAFDRKVAEGALLHVFCAAGVMPAVEQAALKYEEEYGVQIQLQSGSSGGLEQQIKLADRGDLYIPAGRDPFIERMIAEGYVRETMPLAQFRLVLGVKPGNPKQITSLADVAKEGTTLVIASESAAVGRKTRAVLGKSPLWLALEAKATATTTVTEVASAVQLGGHNADAGLIWNSTAKEFDLEIVDVPELSVAVNTPSTITAGVLKTATNPTEAIRFARYLAAPEKGQIHFAAHHFDGVAGDPWAVSPHVVLYSGGVNKVAIEKTIAEFKAREGCEVTTTYNGCGSLVSTMKSGKYPDAYFACDVSFVREVQSEFGAPTTISETNMVILVKPGNPKKIVSLADLGRDGIRFGMADEELSALGALTKKLLEEEGAFSQALKQRRTTTPTADMLVMQLTQSDGLDAVIVYEANCNFVGDQGEIVHIDHAQAKAVQPFVIYRASKYPQITQRLLEAIASQASRSRFENSGFRWKVAPATSDKDNRK